MTKEELRQAIRQQKRHFSAEQLREMSLPIIERLLDHPRVRQASSILLYHSLPDEVCTHQAIATLRHAGKQVLLPKVTGDGEMVLLPCGDQLRAGAFGILEPTDGPDPTHDQATALPPVAVVPGMAFDRQGHRLGRGRGYYDRLLSRSNPRPYLIGLCFPFQMVGSVPTDDRDIPMDDIVC